MLQATQAMARASRQVINELNKYADVSNVQGFLIPAHIYMCDYMIIKYNQAAIINVIKSHMTKIPVKKREYKHFTPLYWYKIVDNMLSNKQGVERNNDVEIHGEIVDYNAFNHITKLYLLDDYSVQDAILINQIVNKYNLSDIISACKTASQNGAYSMSYVSAVLRDIDARKRAESMRIDFMRNRIKQSSESINTTIHRHTPIELAKAEYDYNKKREDMMLELLMNKMFGDKNDN